MIRTATSLLILTAALAGTASAKEIRVSLAGKSAKTISAEIQAAASTVCRQAYADDLIGPHEMNSCIRAAVLDAEAQAKAVGKSVALASNQTASPRR